MNIETGMGAMNQGYNGEIGWSDNPMTGAQLLDGDQLAGMKLQADFYAPLNYSKHFTSMETVEETDFNGQAAYKVKLVNAAGKESFQYFAKDGGLLLGSQGVQAGPMGESEVKTSFSDYKDFGGAKIPGKVTHRRRRHADRADGRDRHLRRRRGDRLRAAGGGQGAAEVAERQTSK